MAIMTVKDNAVPSRVYRCEFEGVEETHHEVYGAGLLWKFVVIKGRFKGKTVGRTTKCEPTPRNSCGKFLAALAGKTPEDEMQIDPDDHEGERYLVTVTEGKNGGTRVESFVREPDEDEGKADSSQARYPGQEPEGFDKELEASGQGEADDVPFDVE